MLRGTQAALVLVVFFIIGWFIFAAMIANIFVAFGYVTSYCYPQSNLTICSPTPLTILFYITPAGTVSVFQVLGGIIGLLIGLVIVRLK
jgi:hypothetical protein